MRPHAEPRRHGQEHHVAQRWSGGVRGYVPDTSSDATAHAPADCHRCRARVVGSAVPPGPPGGAPPPAAAAARSARGRVRRSRAAVSLRHCWKEWSRRAMARKEA